jgi:hypothetical protein
MLALGHRDVTRDDSDVTVVIMMMLTSCDVMQFGDVTRDESDVTVVMMMLTSSNVMHIDDVTCDFNVTLKIL